MAGRFSWDSIRIGRRIYEERERERRGRGRRGSIDNVKGGRGTRQPTVGGHAAAREGRRARGRGIKDSDALAV